MSPIDPTLEQTARRYCRQAHRHHLERDDAGCQQLLWMLDELAGLIAAYHNHPPHRFVEVARRFVDERTFIEDAGDPVVDEKTSEEAQSLIALAVQVHRAVHHHAQASPDRHDLPVPPQMCG